MGRQPSFAVVSLLADPWELLACQHIHDTGATYMRLHNNPTRMFREDLSDNTGLLTERFLLHGCQDAFSIVRGHEGEQLPLVRQIERIEAKQFARPGDIVTITGTGFAPLVPVNIELGGLLMKTTGTKSDGSFATYFMVDYSTPQGAQTLTVTDAQGNTDSVPLYVVPSGPPTVPTPTPGGAPDLVISWDPTNGGAYCSAQATDHSGTGIASIRIEIDWGMGAGYEQWRVCQGVSTCGGYISDVPCYFPYPTVSQYIYIRATVWDGTGNSQTATKQVKKTTCPLFP